MTLALRLAAKGRGTASPNPMVGAVVVKEDGSSVRGFTSVPVSLMLKLLPSVARVSVRMAPRSTSRWNLVAISINARHPVCRL